MALEQDSVLCSQSPAKKIPTPESIAPNGAKMKALLQMQHGMTPDEVAKICDVIEKQRPEWGKAKQPVILDCTLPHLPRDIEYDPFTGHTYIHLQKQGVEKLGAGGCKQVWPSVLYEKAQIVAQAVITAEKKLEGSDSSSDEEDDD
ncbi:MAG TPA: hypothetical protein VN457_08135, partial [Chlamydiales bacterium]|nr:hypothetical protein [Chlamydiales bacterium]